MRFETELGVNINAPPPVPGAKPDHNALADLAKESINLLKTTKEPIVLEQGGSTTAVTIPGSLGQSSTTPKPAEESSTSA